MASLLSPLSLLLVCFLFCLPSSAVEYNETLAITMVDYAGAAYCCGNLGHGVKNWNCNACKLNPGTINITVFSDLLTQANGFVGFVILSVSLFLSLFFPLSSFLFLLNFLLFRFNVPQNRIIVAFSGTDPLDLANLIDDINIEHTKYPYCNKCKVLSSSIPPYHSLFPSPIASQSLTPFTFLLSPSFFLRSIRVSTLPGNPFKTKSTQLLENSPQLTPMPLLLLLDTPLELLCQSIVFWD